MQNIQNVRVQYQHFWWHFVCWVQRKPTSYELPGLLRGISRGCGQKLSVLFSSFESGNCARYPIAMFTLGSGLNHYHMEKESCLSVLRPPTNSQLWAFFWQESLYYYYCKNGKLMCLTQKELRLRLRPLVLPTVKAEYWEPRLRWAAVGRSSYLLAVGATPHWREAGWRALPLPPAAEESWVSVLLRIKYQRHTSRIQYSKLNPNS